LLVSRLILAFLVIGLLTPTVGALTPISHLSNSEQRGIATSLPPLHASNAAILGDTTEPLTSPQELQTRNVTIANPQVPSKIAQIRLVQLRPGQVETPTGFVINASQLVVVQKGTTVSPRPQDKGKPLGIVLQINGWISYGYYNYTGSLTFMSAEWRVPTNPPTTGSLVYWFPGLESDSHIIQPVLQWGAGPEGGGNYWVIANWYAGCATCTYYVSNHVQVYPGDLIYGSVSQSGLSPSLYLDNSCCRPYYEHGSK
jgi:hypothetical protein